jgi:hypothetical protein
MIESTESNTVDICQTLVNMGHNLKNLANEAPVSTSGPSPTPRAPRPHADQAPGSSRRCVSRPCARPRRISAPPHTGQSPAPWRAGRKSTPPPCPSWLLQSVVNIAYKRPRSVPPCVRAPFTSMCLPPPHHWSAAAELHHPLATTASQPP